MVRIEDAPADWESRGGVGHAMMTGRVGLLSLIVGILPGWLFADEPGRRAVDYTRRHQAGAQQALLCLPRGIAAEGRAAARYGGPHEKRGDSGAAVEPGSSGESLIIDAITGAQGWRMPPESEGRPFRPTRSPGSRPGSTKGRKSPADEVPQPDPRRHWSFQRPIRPKVPSAGELGDRADGSATRLTRCWR